MWVYCIDYGYCKKCMMYAELFPIHCMPRFTFHGVILCGAVLLHGHSKQSLDTEKK